MQNQYGCIGLIIIYNYCTITHIPATTEPPLPPAPQLELVSFSKLNLTWDEPFTWQQYPIQEYTITMSNSSSQTKQTSTRTSQQRSLVVSLGTEVARICSELTFDITATNGVGESTPGRVSGGFPLGKSFLPLNSLCAVALKGQQKPQVSLDRKSDSYGQEWLAHPT